MIKKSTPHAPFLGRYVFLQPWKETTLSTEAVLCLTECGAYVAIELPWLMGTNSTSCTYTTEVVQDGDAVTIRIVANGTTFELRESDVPNLGKVITGTATVKYEDGSTSAPRPVMSCRYHGDPFWAHFMRQCSRTMDSEHYPFPQLAPVHYDMRPKMA